MFIPEEREKLQIDHKDEEYLENPYLIYEDLRFTNTPVALSTIDLGLYLKQKSETLLPDNLVFDDPLNTYRIRALTIQQLEYAALQGHTLLPRKQLINQIRNLSISPACPLNSDYYEIAEESFDGVLSMEEMKDGQRAYQLDRFNQTRTILNRNVNERVNAKRLKVSPDWKELLDAVLAEFTEGDPDEQELKARRKKQQH